MRNVIYILVCRMTNELRYVGQAMSPKSRYQEHMNAYNRTSKTHKNNWLNKVLPLGFKPEMIIIESFENPLDLDEAEEFWIAYYRSVGCRLTNSTNGGKGAKGNVHSSETRKLISDKTKLRDWSNFIPHNKQTHYIIFGVELRKCKKCGESKPVNSFNKRTSQSSGLQNYCKPCNAAANREFKERNPPTLLTPEEHAVIRQENHKKSSETLKKTYEARPELKVQLSKQRSKAIQGVNVLTQEVITFSSALAAKEAGFQNSNIGQAIKLNKAYRGYSWSFIKEAV